MVDDKLTLAQVQNTYGQLPEGKELLYDWYGANTWLFKFINDIHGPTYDAFMVLVTQLGNKYLVLQYMAALGVYALGSILYRKLFRKGGVRQHFVMWVGVFSV